MLKPLRLKFKNFLFSSRRLLGMEKQSVILGEIREAQIAGIRSFASLADTEFSVFSQWGEDGILTWLANVVGPKAKTFIEFGVEDYRESNTRFLLIAKYWRGLIIDGSADNIASIHQDNVSYKYDIEATKSFITAENINHIISAAKIGDHVGILSTDIDGVDYWVLKAIDTTADIVTVEYNDLFGDAPVTVPYDPAFVRLNKHWSGVYWGASLAAFSHLLNEKGYTFVGTNRAGTNAFYVANAHAPNVLGKLDEAKAWPCYMRDVRKADGAMAYARTRDMGHLIADLPLADVVTGEMTTLAKLAR